MAMVKSKRPTVTDVLSMPRRADEAVIKVHEVLNESNLSIAYTIAVLEVVKNQRLGLMK